MSDSTTKTSFSEVTKIDFGVPASIKFHFTTGQICKEIMDHVKPLFAELSNVRVEAFIGKSHECHLQFVFDPKGKFEKGKNTLYKACVTGDTTSSGKKSVVTAFINRTATAAAANLIRPHDDLLAFRDDIAKVVSDKDNNLTMQQVVKMIDIQPLINAQAGTCIGLDMKMPFEVIIDYFLSDNYVVAKQDSVEIDVDADGNKAISCVAMDLPIVGASIPVPVVVPEAYGMAVRESALYELELIVAGGTPVVQSGFRTTF